MFMYGGIDQGGNTLSDMWVYNMEIKNWNDAHLSRKMPKLSHHTMTPVFSNLKSRVLDVFSKKMFDGPKVSI